eukprot:492966-Karenia_brevis.AAC.1
MHSTEPATLDLVMMKCGVFSTSPALKVGGGQCRVGTWNSRALFTANPVKRAKRISYIKKALDQLDILFVQKTHGTIADIYAAFPEHL